MRLVQLYHTKLGRRVALVAEPELQLIDSSYQSTYHLFTDIIEKNKLPNEFIPNILTDDRLDYDSIYEGKSPWKLLSSFDHPDHPLFCMLSGTGLTHKASAENRQKMHQQIEDNDNLTDSMEIYMWGEKGGKPSEGEIGIQPEWFYKGNGTMLKGYNQTLEVPSFGNDGGEEPEIAGVYVIGPDRTPYRIGFTVANEFSDHIMEKKNYLYLAPSKLRSCAIGPELILDENFDDVPGRVSIIRNQEELWSKAIRSGEKNMSHSLANLEYHHFKYDQHRIPGMVHIHFFGADAFSFGENIALEDGDLMNVSFEGFGRPLVNPLSISDQPEIEIPIRAFN